MELGVMDLRASPIPDLFGVAEVRLEGFIAQNEWQSEYTVTGGFRGRLGREQSGSRAGAERRNEGKRRRRWRIRRSLGENVGDVLQDRTRLQLMRCALAVRCVLISERRELKTQVEHKGIMEGTVVVDIQTEGTYKRATEVYIITMGAETNDGDG